MFGNRTNNRIESINQKLKAVIAKYSSMPSFTKLLITCVGSMTIEKDIHAAEELMRKPADRSKYGAHDVKYSELLTNFAFQKYFAEATQHDQVQFDAIDNMIAVTGMHVRAQRMLTTQLTCDCVFFMSMGLPCRHILSFRKHNNVDLFDPTLCSERWSKQKMITVSQMDYVLDDEPNIDIAQTTSQNQRPRAKNTTNQKYRKADDKCKSICALISELPQNEFNDMYLKLCDLEKEITQAANHNSQPRATRSLTQRSTSASADEGICVVS